MVSKKTHIYFERKINSFLTQKFDKKYEVIISCILGNIDENH